MFTVPQPFSLPPHTHTHVTRTLKSSSTGRNLFMCAHCMQEEAKVGRTADDIGNVLHRFLRRFGSLFDTKTMVVSVQHGGLAQRSEMGSVYTEGILQRIAVRDPLTGVCVDAAVCCQWSTNIPFRHWINYTALAG